jgi:hypothetical protein
MTEHTNAGPALAICIHNEGYEVSLELRKLYKVVSDPDALKNGLLRVVDESGEDYLYPEGFFIMAHLPKAEEQAVLETA